jgi:tellurite resistance protein
MKILPEFWLRTPPALFPCLLGFIGLGLAWRRAAEIWPVTPWIGEGILLVSCVLFMITGTFYHMKLSLRPSIVFEDLKFGPSRGTVSAGSMCLMLYATALTPYMYELAQIFWWAAVLQHAAYMVCVTLSLAKSDTKLSEVNPSLILPYVGYIVATIGGPGLGYATLSGFFLMVTIPGCIFIITLSLINLKKHNVNNTLRANYFIILAPLSIYGIGAFNIWSTEVYTVLWYVALVCGLCLLPFLGWFSAGGWSPAWGAFTFPLSAFAGVMLTGVQSHFGLVADIGSVVSLGIATLVVPYIVWKTYLHWLEGKLALSTGAVILK